MVMATASTAKATAAWPHSSPGADVLRSGTGQQPGLGAASQLTRWMTATPLRERPCARHRPGATWHHQALL